MADEKTEQPTPRRLKKAREEGDSGVSASSGYASATACIAEANACTRVPR